MEKGRLYKFISRGESEHKQYDMHLESRSKQRLVLIVLVDLHGDIWIQKFEERNSVAYETRGEVYRAT